MARTVAAGGRVGSYDVLVVGCGPVGAVLAARLGALGMRTLVVERSAEVHPLPRAVAADDEVQHLLALVAPGLLDGALHDVPVRLVDASRRPLGELRLPAGPSGHSGLALFHQPTLEHRLRRHLAALPTVTVRTGVELVGWTQDAYGVTGRLADGVTGGEAGGVTGGVADGVTGGVGGGGAGRLADGVTERAAWLVGCDGASSFLRRTCGIAWRGRDLARWLVVDVAGEVDRPALTYTCDPARPQVDMPLPGGHRWEWLLREGEPAVDPGTLLSRDVDPAAVSVVRAVTYRYGARSAASWQAGRVLLAGDAAHTMPPFAGQGLGAGLRDAWVLAGMLGAGDPSGYEALRAPHVAGMTRLSLLLGGIVETRSAVLAGPRDVLLRSAFRAPVLGPWLSRGGPRSTASGVLNPLLR